MGVHRVGLYEYYETIFGDLRTLTDKDDRDAMADTTRFLDQQKCLTIAMYEQHQKHDNILRDSWKVGFTDCGLLAEEPKQCFAYGNKLSVKHMNMFADHQRNKLTRVMLAQMKQCDGFDFGVDETTAFSWPAIHPQDDCIWEVPCFVAAAARTKQDVVTLTNDLVTGDFLGDDVIENCWYVWSANSTVSERRANKRDCLEKFVRA